MKHVESLAMHSQDDEQNGDRSPLSQTEVDSRRPEPGHKYVTEIDQR